LIEQDLQKKYNILGTVWLFGKVWVESAKCFVSCCVTVKNIPRRIYLAQREFRADSHSGQTLPGEQVSISYLFPPSGSEPQTRR
jgi:hypothetical protein